MMKFTKKGSQANRLRTFFRFLICVEGISQAGMLAFRFGAAHEREKLAERVSHRSTTFR